MTDTRSARRPRRDADGRVAAAPDLIGVALGGQTIGFVVLLAYEGIMSLLRLSEFGHASGWLSLILPLWLFVEEFRAATYGAYRVVVAILGVGFGLAAGMTLAGLAAQTFPPLVSGTVGAAASVVVYSLVWFYGLRWLSHRAG
ncbi:hypothetical protein [Mangrovihabitans endophyticus]|uniref:Uncharacterized protein n=1 Tax=Mangrovihabitans endophyticus TaxID=1751298 RepID=A0A8J3FQ16_9ACTN|nr:hypothetical protein [Mangrovihabitans endophyticus]GGK97175.1 hypothetical protein GCM10012284_34280 [Mangrovihabitans endophyticus]